MSRRKRIHMSETRRLTQVWEIDGKRYQLVNQWEPNGRGSIERGLWRVKTWNGSRWVFVRGVAEYSHIEDAIAAVERLHTEGKP